MKLKRKQIILLMKIIVNFFVLMRIYPFIKTKTKGKRTHNEIIDESNELKIFLEHLQFPKIK